MMRPRNWDVALAQWARSVVGQPFVWGETDCVWLVRAALRTIYGRDVLPATPSWSTLRGAKRAAAVTTIGAALEGVGAVVVPFVSAQAGDVLMLGRETSGFDGVGVVLDEQVLLANPDRGVYAVRRTEWHDLELQAMRV